MKKLFLLLPAIAFMATACDLPGGYSLNYLTIEKKGSSSGEDIPSGDESKILPIYVIWKNYNGDILEVDFNLKEGETPHYDSSTPKHPVDDIYTYSFAGWDKTPGPISKSTVYVATFTPVKRINVTWLNYDGKVLRTDYDLYKGQIPYYGADDPVRPSDAKYTYEFSGWDKTPGPIYESTTYQAQYNKTLRKYNISWYQADGSLIGTNKVDYGTTPSVPIGQVDIPENTEYADYKFEGWDKPVSTVTGDASYTAVISVQYFNTVDIEYKFNDTVHEIDNSMNDILKRVGRDVILCTPSCEGYNFDGWYLDSGYTKQITSIPNISDDMQVYGKFSLANYSISYDLDGGAWDVEFYTPAEIGQLFMAEFNAFAGTSLAFS